MSHDFSQTNNTPLVRSDNRVFAGVSAAIAERLDVPPWGIRLLWILFFLCYGTGLLIYILAAFAFPTRETAELHQGPRILGVCWRISRALKVDVGMVRFVTLFLGIGSIGSFLVVYVVLHFVMDRSKMDFQG